jgi:hypothetical protein
MKTTTKKWSDESRQAFADRNILKATRIPNKKREASRKACRGGSWN